MHETRRTLADFIGLQRTCKAQPYPPYFTEQPYGRV
jgi:hypothetical protein